MNPPSKYTRIHPSPDSLKAIRESSPSKSISNKSEGIEPQVRQGMSSAPSLLDHPVNQGLTTRVLANPDFSENHSDENVLDILNFLEPALNIDTAQEQTLELEAILEELLSLLKKDEHKQNYKAILNKLDEAFERGYCDELERRIKDKAMAHEVTLLLRCLYGRRFHDTGKVIKTLQNITDEAVRNETCAELVQHFCDDGNPMIMDTDVERVLGIYNLITNPKMSQELVYYIASLLNYENAEIIMEAAKQITDTQKRDDILCGMIQVFAFNNLPIVMEVAKQITDTQRRDKSWFEIVKRFKDQYPQEVIEAAKQITDTQKRDNALLQVARNFRLNNPEIIMEAAKLITNSDIQQRAFFHLAGSYQRLTKEDPKKAEDVKCNLLWLEAASLLEDQESRLMQFKSLGQCKGGYGLKKQLKQLDSLPREASARQAKLEAMFNYPTSLNAHDQEALLEIHQRLCSQAQSLDEKIKWSTDYTHDFLEIYRNPSVSVAARMGHLSYMCEFKRDIGFEYLNEPSLQTDSQKYWVNYLLNSPRTYGLNLNTSESLCGLELKVVVKLFIEIDGIKEKARCMKLIFSNSQGSSCETDFINRIKNKIIEDAAKEGFAYGKVIKEGDSAIEILKSQNFTTYNFVDFLESYEDFYFKIFYNKCNDYHDSFIRYQNLIKSIVEKLHSFKGDELKLIVSSYLQGPERTSDETFNSIVNCILQDETLTRPLRATILELLFQEREYIRFTSYVCKIENFKAQFYLFLQEADPCLQSVNMEYLPILNTPIFGEYMEMLSGEQLIQHFEEILDLKRKKSIKVAPREDDAA